MALLQRDNQHHTYADYLTWSREHGDELINGVAYIREPPASKAVFTDARLLSS